MVALSGLSLSVSLSACLSLCLDIINAGPIKRSPQRGVTVNLADAGACTCPRPHLPRRHTRQTMAWSSSRWTGFCHFDVFAFKSPPYALTTSKTALSTALTQGLPRCTLKPPAQAHWPHWQRSRRSSGMLRTAVDDGVVDFGLFSCNSRLAACTTRPQGPTKAWS